MNNTAFDRAKAVDYRVTYTDECCLNCEHSRTAHYYPSGTKFVCDELNIQTHENYRCNLFKHKGNE